MRVAVTSSGPAGSYVYGEFPKYGHGMMFLSPSKKVSSEGRRDIHKMVTD
jgi:hypothetical protein